MSSTTPQAANLMSQVGGSALGSVVGEGMGLLFNGINNQNQLNQQGQLDQQALGYNEQMSAYNYGQQLNLWNETNYPAQVKQLEAAGLNPGLLYGSHGAGASATTGSPSGGIPPGMAPSQSMAQTAQLAIQSQEAQADIKLKNAQADKLNQETPNVGANIQASTASLTQGVENQKAQEALTQMQTIATAIQNSIQGQSIDDQIAAIRAGATQIESTAAQAVRNNYIDQNTMDQKIAQAKANLLGTILQNQLTTAQTGQTNAQTDATVTGIEQRWKEMIIQNKNADANTKNAAVNEFINNMPKTDQMSREMWNKLMPSLFLGL